MCVCVYVCALEAVQAVGCCMCIVKPARTTRVAGYDIEGCSTVRGGAVLISICTEFVGLHKGRCSSAFELSLWNYISLEEQGSCAQVVIRLRCRSLLHDKKGAPPLSGITARHHSLLRLALLMPPLSGITARHHSQPYLQHRPAGMVPLAAGCCACTQPTATTSRFTQAMKGACR